MSLTCPVAPLQSNTCIIQRQQFTQLRLNHRAIFMVKDMFKWICSKTLSPPLSHLFPQPHTSGGPTQVWVRALEGFNWTFAPTETFIASSSALSTITAFTTASPHAISSTRPMTIPSSSHATEAVCVAELNCSACTHPLIWHKASVEMGPFGSSLLLSSLRLNLAASHQILRFSLQFYFQLVSALFQLFFLLTDCAFFTF